MQSIRRGNTTNFKRNKTLLEKGLQEQEEVNISNLSRKGCINGPHILRNNTVMKICSGLDCNDHSDDDDNEDATGIFELRIEHIEKKVKKIPRCIIR